MGRENRLEDMRESAAMTGDVLIIDDELSVRKAFSKLFADNGCTVRTAKNAAEAAASFVAKRPDLVLLDVDMPGSDGFTVCEQLRSLDATLPILFLTAMETDEDKLHGFRVGADDYIFKSAPTAELLARAARALARNAARSPDGADLPRQIVLDGVTVDFDRLTVARGRRAERLTKTEADFLWLLASERGRFFPIDEIIDVLRGTEAEITGAAVASHVWRLKKKLGPAGLLIENSRRSGYALLDV